MIDEASDPIRIGPVRTPEGAAARRRSVNYAGLLRVILPVGAAALVAGLFFGGELFGDPDATESGFWTDEAPITSGSVGEGAVAQGVTPNGYAYLITAARARPDGVDATRLELDDFSGTIELEGGRSVTLTAPRGVFMRLEQTARLDGGVVVATNDGYRVETEGVAANVTDAVENRKIESRGRILGFGPAGRICAERMTLLEAEGGVARFDGDVVVILTDLPGAEGADGATVASPPPRDEGEVETPCQQALWAVEF